MTVIAFPKTVYIVDGDPALCQSAQVMLEAHQRTVHIIESAKDFAREYLTPNGAPCECLREQDVILLDLNQDSPAVFNLLNRLMLHDRRPAIVLTTPVKSSLRPEDTFSTNRICVLQHPIAPRALLQVIDQITATQQRAIPSA